MSNKSKQFINYATLEETLEMVPNEKSITIGIPKESTFQENRVALTPEGVNALVMRGNEVLVEAGAGNEAHFTDQNYSEAGAQIIYNKKDIFKSHIILKVAPIGEDEVEFLQANQTVFSPLHLPIQTSELISKIQKKNIIGVALELLKDGENSYPIVRSMSEIAGNASIIQAAKYLSKSGNGRGELLGGISGIFPSKVVILGSGIVGLFAARTAKGLGADVQIFDNNIYRLMRIQDQLGIRIATSVMNPISLSKALKHADVVVGAMQPINGVIPCVVSEEMVAQMKSGSVIVDVNIDRGGCIETSRITTHEKPIFTKHGVLHYCVPNIPSGYPHTASIAISNVLMPLVSDIANFGYIENLTIIKPFIKESIYTYKGHITNSNLAKRLDLKFTDIELFLTLNES